MTPKEKAIELVNKFRLNVLDYEGNGLNLFKAKQCALILVEEILNSDHNNLHSEYDYNECKLGVDIEYWVEVKTEINNL
jgi:hypothetical protein